MSAQALRLIILMRNCHGFIRQFTDSDWHNFCRHMLAQFQFICPGLPGILVHLVGVQLAAYMVNT
jgi:hypothetical protein